MSDHNILVAESYRQAELRLEWQFNSAIAADQRAISLAGMYIASAAILAGLTDSSQATFTLLIPAMFLVVAAIFAGIAARPQKFYAPGAKFGDLEQDISENRSINDVKTEVGGFHDKHIEANDASMKSAKTWLSMSFFVAIVGLGVAILGRFSELT